LVASGKSAVVLQRHLRDCLGRTGKTEPAGIERYVV
jgi:hypothetical protein